MLTFLATIFFLLIAMGEAAAVTSCHKTPAGTCLIEKTRKAKPIKQRPMPRQSVRDFWYEQMLTR
jgi:hypothetical protein